MQFINREDEINSLNDKWDQKAPQFIIIYGRRRIGKTELIKQFIQGKNAIYFLGDQRNEQEQLKELGRIIGGKFADNILSSRGFENWPEVFKYLKGKINDRFIFAVDEFPYLVSADKAVSSLFQKGWDEYLRQTNILLILCGSSVSIMEREVLDYSSALYGRRTGQIHLTSLTFKNSWGFFPKRTFEDFLKIFAICDGIPQYLTQFDPNKNLIENIKNKIFKKTEFLYNEVEFLLKGELREPKNYMSILKAISFGKTKFSEIINDTGLKRNILMKYIKTLENLKIIKKEVPITEKIPHKSRKGVYKISDNFIRFWFQYVFPYKSELEIENYSEVLTKIEKFFNFLLAVVYEEVCKEMIWKFRNKIFAFEKVGKWWDNNNEIDIIALNQGSKEILFGEAKWSNKQVGIDIYKNLKNKTQYVDWNLKGRKEHYILFSKSGFTDDMLKLAMKENVFLVHLNNLITV